jgi:hypothetical protein
VRGPATRRRDVPRYRRAAALGLLSGLGGAGVMTVAEKLEQAVTGRPNSYMPAHTLGHLLGLRDADRDSWPRNMAMHYGQAALIGSLRGVWAAANLRGPRAALMFWPIRLSTDQTLENATGTGAPPWTWPRDELVVDLLHKGVFALATGAIADALIPPAPGSSARRRYGRRRRSGR